MNQSMQGKTVLVTGATDGIGKATALELARLGAQVIVHGRSHTSATRAIDEIRASLPAGDLLPAAADLGDLEQVRALATDISAHFDRLDVLINNAGVFEKQRRLSADGYELTFAVNHLAHFALTLELLPLLRQSQARVITVSSMVHQRGRIDFDDLMAERGYSGYDAYAQSKLANVLFSNMLARREQGKLTSNSLHPGVIATKLLHTGFRMGGNSVESGAETSVYLASSAHVEGETGQYYADSRQAQPSPQALDVDAQERLWQISADLCGINK